VTNDGRLFHARAAATGKACSPIVLRRVAGTMTADDELERSLRLVSTSATRLMLSARYTGSVPWYTGTCSMHDYFAFFSFFQRRNNFVSSFNISFNEQHDERRTLRTESLASGFLIPRRLEVSAVVDSKKIIARVSASDHPRRLNLG